MLQNTYTLGLNTYDKRLQNAMSSQFSREDLAHPRTLNVSHATRKNSTIVDTVLYITDDAPITNSVSGNINLSRIRGQFKFSYDPLGGRTDINAQIIEMITELKSLIDTNLGSLLNKES